MSNFVRARAAIAPLALSVAAAAFLAAGTMATPSYAQQDNTQNPPTAAAPAHRGKLHHATAAHEATSMRPESVEQRIAQLKTQLKITPSEESDWNAIAEVMRDNAKSMQQLIDQTRAESPRDQRNALQDLQTYQKFAQAHAEGLQKLTTAFGTLYNAMTPEEKANADKVFHAFEQRRPTGRT